MAGLEWRYTIDGVEQQPLPWSGLVHLIRIGALKPEDTIFDPQHNDWVPAGSMTGLFPANYESARRRAEESRRVTPVMAVQRMLTAAFIAALLLGALAYFKKGALPVSAEIAPGLSQDPIQEKITKENFSFSYAGEKYDVKPIANYEIWGVVVSHNNIASIADIYHKITDVDTKDLGLIWGRNLENEDYLKTKYWSVSYALYHRPPPGRHLDISSMSNNHLITSDPAVRKTIGKVRIGDQVHIAGMLVDYRYAKWPDSWRPTSVLRSDHGCEIIFVKNIEILRRGTPGWYLLFNICFWAVILIPAAKFVLLGAGTGKRKS